MSTCLVDRDDVRIDFDYIQQEFLVTHAAEFVFFLLGRQAGKVIFVSGLDTPRVTNYFGSERDSLGGAYNRTEGFAPEKPACLPLYGFLAGDWVPIVEK